MKPVLVDSCIIIDLLAEEGDWYQWSLEKLSRLYSSHVPAVNQIIYAEVASAYDTPADAERALFPFESRRLSLPWEAPEFDTFGVPRA